MTRRAFLRASLAIGLTWALAPTLSRAQLAPIVIKFSHVELIERADHLMLRGKRSGKGGIFRS